MARVFISNSIVQESGDIKIDASFDVSNFVTDQHKNGYTTFIIDVHCTFKGAEKLQQQGGVIIYRHLLNQFKDCQDNLKVVFYSPISKEHLAALRPENYVLTLLPFVQCEYDGSFETKLKTEIQKYSFKKVPVFNNASENLLSGWSLFKADKNRKENDFVETQYKFRTPDEKPRKIRFIDDQINEWKKTYTEIFEPEADLKFLEYKKNPNEVGKFDENKIDNLNNNVMQASLIVADFYLEENHESNNWMSSKELSQKSGFQLYQKIKGTKDDEGIHKGVPYVMHTSSNKIQYYKFLDANGVDNWLVKDTRTNSTTQEKKENFYAFKKVIEEFTYENSSELYKIMKKFWEQIEELEKDTEANWWYSASIKPNTEIVISKLGGVSENVEVNTATYENKDEAIKILKDSWMALRNILNKETYFAENIGSNDKHFTPAAVCSNLGKLFEFFGFDQGMDFNYFFRYLFCVRNAASHYNGYNQIELDDCLAYFDSWLYALESKAKNLNDTNLFGKCTFKEELMVQSKGKKAKDSFEYSLLYVYLQYYNSYYLKVNTLSNKIIKRRIISLLDNANKNVLYNEIESDITIGYNRGKLLKNGNEKIVYSWTASGNKYGIYEDADNKLFITNNA